MTNETEKTNNSKMTVGAVFGEAVWLLSQSPRHRFQVFIGDLEWSLMPAVVNGQFRIFRHEGKPVAMALWALVNEEVDNRLSQGMTRLKPEEWKSGRSILGRGFNRSFWTDRGFAKRAFRNCPERQSLQMPYCFS